MSSFRVVLAVHRRALWKERTASLLTVFGVAVGIALVVGLTVLGSEMKTPFEAAGSQLAEGARGTVIQVEPKVEGGLKRSTFDSLGKDPGVVARAGVVTQLTPLTARKGSVRTGVLFAATNCGIEKFVGEIACERTKRKAASGPGFPLGLSWKTAADLGVELGDAVALPGHAYDSSHVGWILPETRNLGGVNRGSVVVASLETAGYLYERPGMLTSGFLLMRDGASTDGIEKKMRNVATVGKPRGKVPPGLLTVTQALGSLSIFGLVIGVLTAVSTLLATLERRRRLTATVTVLGATRIQALSGLLFEGAVLGVLGGAVGVVPGYFFGLFLLDEFGDAILRGTGVALGSSFKPSLVLLALLTGAVAGAVAVVQPAVQIVREGPLPSLVGSTGAERLRRVPLWPLPVGVSLMAAGAFVMKEFGDGRVSLMAGSTGLMAGSFGALIVAFVAGPRLAALGARLVGRVFGAEAMVARATVERSPALAGAVLSLLMLGTAIAVGFSSLGTLGARTTASMMERDFGTGVVVEPQPLWDQAFAAISEPVAREVEDATRWSEFGERRSVLIPSDTEPRMVIGVKPSSWYAERLAGLTAEEWSRIAHGEVALSALAAGRLDAVAGDTVRLPTTQGSKAFRVAAVFEPRFVDLSTVGDWIVVSTKRSTRSWGAVRTEVGALPSPRLTSAGSVARVENVRAVLEPLDSATWRTESGSQWSRSFKPFTFTGWLVMIAAGLAVLNLLVIGLLQRRRERAVLRAIGFESRAERRATVLESGLLAVIAAILAVLVSLYLVALLWFASPVYYGFQLEWGVVGRSMAMGLIGLLALVSAATVWPVVLSGRLDISRGLRSE